jgi:hypothetical protein
MVDGVATTDLERVPDMTPEQWATAVRAALQPGPAVERLVLAGRLALQMMDDNTRDDKTRLSAIGRFIQVSRELKALEISQVIRSGREAAKPAVVEARPVSGVDPRAALMVN